MVEIEPESDVPVIVPVEQNDGDQLGDRTLQFLALILKPQIGHNIGFQAPISTHYQH